MYLFIRQLNCSYTHNTLLPESKIKLFELMTNRLIIVYFTSIIILQFTARNTRLLLNSVLILQKYESQFERCSNMWCGVICTSLAKSVTNNTNVYYNAIFYYNS